MNDSIDLSDVDVLTHTQLTLPLQEALSSKDESSYNDCVEAAVENPGTIQEILEIPSSIPQKRKLHKYEKLAVCLGTTKGSSNVTVEEQSIIVSVIGGKTNHNKRNSSLEARFFKTLEEVGSPLGNLETFKEDGICMKREFYIAVRGKKEEQKKRILDECLKLCALCRKNLKQGEKYDTVLDSNTFS